LTSFSLPVFAGLAAVVSLFSALLFAVLPIPGLWAAMLVAPIALISLSYALMPSASRPALVPVRSQQRRSRRSLNG